MKDICVLELISVQCSYLIICVLIVFWFLPFCFLATFKCVLFYYLLVSYVPLNKGVCSQHEDVLLVLFFVGLFSWVVGLYMC